MNIYENTTNTHTLTYSADSLAAKYNTEIRKARKKTEKSLFLSLSFFVGSQCLKCVLCVRVRKRATQLHIYKIVDSKNDDEYVDSLAPFTGPFFVFNLFLLLSVRACFIFFFSDTLSLFRGRRLRMLCTFKKLDFLALAASLGCCLFCLVKLWFHFKNGLDSVFNFRISHAQRVVVFCDMPLYVCVWLLPCIHMWFSMPFLSIQWAVLLLRLAHSHNS